MTMVVIVVGPKDIFIDGARFDEAIDKQVPWGNWGVTREDSFLAIFVPRDSKFNIHLRRLEALLVEKSLYRFQTWIQDHSKLL